MLLEAQKEARELAQLKRLKEFSLRREGMEIMDQ